MDKRAQEDIQLVKDTVVSAPAPSPAAESSISMGRLACTKGGMRVSTSTLAEGLMRHASMEEGVGRGSNTTSRNSIGLAGKAADKSRATLVRGSCFCSSALKCCSSCVSASEFVETGCGSVVLLLTAESPPLSAPRSATVLGWLAAHPIARWSMIDRGFFVSARNSNRSVTVSLPPPRASARCPTVLQTPTRFARHPHPQQASEATRTLLALLRQEPVP